ncbi:hypothetical protein GINT2_001025 [Glugoides intestinalis]
MVGIAQYIEIDSKGTKEFKLLERISYLHKAYSEEEVTIFYNKFALHMLDFNVQKITITEVLYNSKEFMNSINNNLLFQIIANWFIIKNDLSEQFLFAGTSLTQFFIALRNKRATYKHLIEKNKRTVELVKLGKFSSYMLETGENDLSLNKSTHECFINKQISIQDLMDDNPLPFDETKHLLRRITSDRRFAAECKRFIEENGILNETMQVIATLCNIEKVPRNINTGEIYRYFCKTHINTIYRPFKCFKPIGKLTRYEVYFLYLFHKSDLKEDSKDILKALQTDEMDFDLKEIDSDVPDLRKGRTIKAAILDLLLKQTFEIPFDKKVFRLLDDLRAESYFEDFCQLYAKDIIENQVFSSLPSCLLGANSIIKHLKLQNRDNSIGEVKRQRKSPYKEDLNEIKCSLDTIQSLILFSSQEDAPEYTCLSEKEKNIEETFIPVLLDFRKHKWLNEAEKTYLLQYYIQKYDIRDLIENFLVTKYISDSTKVFFLNKVNSISKTAYKYSIYCKTNTKPTHISIKKSSEVIEILNMVENAYQLREYFYTQPISKRLIERFLQGLKLEELGQLIEEIDVKLVTLDFAVKLISVITKKYEFKHIFQHLSNFLDLKRVELIKQIQQYLLEVFRSMFIDESYLTYIEVLYSKMLGSSDKEIKKNNDKILVQIGKIGRYMEKEVYLGNLKSAQDNE